MVFLRNSLSVPQHMLQLSLSVSLSISLSISLSKVGVYSGNTCKDTS
jgi:hypothetical protein